MQKLTPYTTLRDEVVAVLHTARERARQIVERELAGAYWQVGQLLDAHLQAYGGRAAKGEEMVRQLAQDLEMPPRRLYEMLQVYRAFPKVRSIALLSWTHYLRLLKVPEGTREHFLQRAADEGLSVRQLEAAIATGVLVEAQGAAPRKSGPRLQTRRGPLHVYRLVETRRIDGTTALALDLGFGLRREMALKGVVQPTAGQTLVARRQGTGYAFAPIELQRDPLFTFAAVVEKVVDGDTLVVVVDCGFGCRVVQRLRLRGIDAPELKTAAGPRARAFVESELGQVDFVVVKTFRPDKYDRYLADVFYLPGEEDPKKVAAEGRYLNRHLLQKGLAAPFI